MGMKDMPVWHDGEEFINSFLHGIAAIFSFIGTLYLCHLGIESHDIYKLVGNIIFGISLTMTSILSSLYHGSTQDAFKRCM